MQWCARFLAVVSAPPDSPDLSEISPTGCHILINARRVGKSLSKRLLVCVSADPKMPLAQAHPFEPMPVTHEEEMQEVRERFSVCVTCRVRTFVVFCVRRLISFVWLPGPVSSLVFRNERK